ncbi:hypothetical protein EIJ81_01085 (plasmid) [Aliivibrio salmonicida]|uniref:hypothetical protein n=1 Tax=Aliivibrio salmonicida TaxID=40269 RepID=UPI000F6C8BAB|nr:hypothetical protein [Aliivibrio salmonicida]AZL83494.1 hypothetical protein EIJ81_01085 [Aliivibrio salmonicida]
MNFLTFIKDNVGSYSGVAIGVIIFGFILPYFYSAFELSSTIAQVVKWILIFGYGALVAFSFVLKTKYDTN